MITCRASSFSRRKPIQGKQSARLGTFVEQWLSFFRIRGVGLRSGTDPYSILADPAGVDRTVRREMLDTVEEINRQTLAEVGDSRNQRAHRPVRNGVRMQSSVPDLTDLGQEPQSTWDLYGPEARQPGTFAYNCLLARRMAERGVRFTQIYKRGWDVTMMWSDCADSLSGTDRGAYALVTDLKRRGLLDDTLVIWAGDSDAPSTARVVCHKITTAAITIPDVSQHGWRAAASAPGLFRRN